MPCVYIIFSPSLDKFYIGASSQKASIRLEKHNNAYYGRNFTSSANDWQLKLEIPCPSFSAARKMELYIKKMKSRKFILKLIDDPLQVKMLIDICLATDSPD
jgi:putative endonuclease